MKVRRRTSPLPAVTRRQPLFERLEGRALLAGTDVRVFANGLFNVDSPPDEVPGSVSDGWDEGENLVISNVSVETQTVDDLGNPTGPWTLDTDGIVPGVTWRYFFNDPFTGATVEYTVPATEGPNTIIPWSVFDGILDNTIFGLDVTVQAYDGDTPFQNSDMTEAFSSANVLLNNEAPSLNATFDQTGGGGACGGGGPITVTVTASGVDPNSADTVTFYVNWGDGVWEEFVDTAVNGNLEGGDSVQVKAVDDDHNDMFPENYGARFSEPFIVTGDSGGSVGSALLDGSALIITGTCGNDLVSLSTDGVTLSVEAGFLSAPDFTATFSLADVTEIRALLGDGDDIFTVAGNISMPTIVAGGGGNDFLMGGRGRNVLIGGDGSDMLFGGQGEDVLIGGSTVHDNHSAALGALLADWTADLFLPPTFIADIIDDDDHDVLHGGQDIDWLYLDQILDDALCARRDVIVYI